MISLFKRIKLRIKDTATLTQLCQMAEKYAKKRGEGEPGEEHFLLSALELPDGTAQRVFERLGVNEDQLEKAIDQQHIDALSYIGIDASDMSSVANENDDVGEHSNSPFKSKPSAQSLMKELVASRRSDKDIPLLGLHIIEVLSDKKLGIVSRAFEVLGLDQQSVKDAVSIELKNYKLSI